MGDVIDDLVHQGINVYFIDNWSTDRTLAIAESRLRRGVIGTERFPPVGAEADDPRRFFHWEAILRRKEELAFELEADWFIHHDADEFRESPWRHLRLREAIHVVDRAGYNAIDFAVLNFRPTSATPTGQGDIRGRLHHYELGDSWDQLQIKCWKKLPAVRVDLASQGGHEALFPDRRVFPVRFLLRHYPIRSQKHGERKIAHERRGRFLDSERVRGWHVQYDTVGRSFVRDPEQLARFDPDLARLPLFLENRTVEELRSELDAARREAAALASRLRERDSAIAAALEDLAKKSEEAARLATQRSELSNRVAGLESHLGTVIPTLERDLRRTVEEKVERDRSITELHSRLAEEHARLGEETRRRAALEQEAAQIHVALRVAGERLADELEKLSEEARRRGMLEQELARAHGALEEEARRRAALAQDLAQVRGVLQEEGRQRVVLDQELTQAHGAFQEEIRRRAAVEQELAQAHGAFRAVEDRLSRVLASRTWRWTAPIRRLVGFTVFTFRRHTLDGKP